MNPYIFVYGTLKKSHSNPVASYFHLHAEFVGQGRLKGAMIDFGAYPGACHDPASDHFVVGEIFKMDYPEKVLKVLDEYEGIGSSFPEPHEYVRALCPVEYKHGTVVCWVYLYNWDLPIERKRDGPVKRF